VAKIINKGLGLLGIQAIDKMWSEA
jgi:hypothetical protein